MKLANQVTVATPQLDSRIGFGVRLTFASDRTECPVEITIPVQDYDHAEAICFAINNPKEG